MSESLKEKAYKYLRRKIAAGELSPDTKLSNRALAKEIGVSFIPIREAIHQLVSEGIMVQKNGVGFFVANPSEDEIIEIYEIRKALEIHAAIQASKLASTTDIEELRRINSDFAEMIQKAANDPNNYPDSNKYDDELVAEIIRQDGKFHLAILKIAKNQRLMKIVHDSNLITRFHKRKRIFGSWDLLKLAVDEHAQMIDGIERQDTDLLRSCIDLHIEHGKKTMLRIYGEYQNEERERNDIFSDEL